MAFFRAWRNGPKRGAIIYKKLVEKYGKCRIYINHYPGTGDVYITSRLFRAWSEKTCSPDYVPVFTVIGASARKVALLFSIENVEQLTQNDTNALIKFYELCGNKLDLPIEIMHYHANAMNTGILDTMASVHDLNFLRIYLDIVFPGLTWEDATPIKENASNEKARTIMKEHGLTEGKTVLLAPDTHSITPLSVQFWNYLVNGLKEKGYSVCTNLGSPDEEPLEGTEGVFIPYSELYDFLKLAGTTIQLRSGLTDLICEAECRKIILYPIESHYIFGQGTLYDYFSLSRMRLCSDAEEYEFTRIRERVVCEKILRSLDDHEADCNCQPS